MWWLFQSAIIFAVIASNIRWQWTPNGHLAGLIGVGLAYGLTVGLNELCRLAERHLRKGQGDTGHPVERIHGPR
jgi:hypothetical protein